jgi:hypothetical protein
MLQSNLLLLTYSLDTQAVYRKKSVIFKKVCVSAAQIWNKKHITVSNLNSVDQFLTVECAHNITKT